MRDSFTDPAAMLRHLQIEPSTADIASPKATGFRMLVPREFAQLMSSGDLDDPLLRQVLPVMDELKAVEGFGDDPVGDEDARVAAGVLRKYQGRVLLILTGACPIHCRYCFRRQYNYESSLLNDTRMQQAIAYIRADPSVHEVILSGGDPLMADDDRLERLIVQLNDISHVRRLRLHSRMPLVTPQRITDRLVGLLTRFTRPVTMVVHCNHPNEISHAQAEALKRLRIGGILLLNQSVLLRGVNDEIRVLSDLSESLFDHGVIPYYLHVLDKVAGAAHFEVDKCRGQELIEGVRQSLSGYLTPKLVQEIAGAASKIVC